MRRRMRNSDGVLLARRRKSRCKNRMAAWISASTGFWEFALAPTCSMTTMSKGLGYSSARSAGAGGGSALSSSMAPSSDVGILRNSSMYLYGVFVYRCAQSSKNEIVMLASSSSSSPSASVLGRASNHNETSSMSCWNRRLPVRLLSKRDWIAARMAEVRVVTWNLSKIPRLVCGPTHNMNSANTERRGVRTCLRGP